MNRIKFDLKIIDTFITSKLRESGVKVYKNEAHREAVYPFILYKYTQDTQENKGVFNLSIFIWSTTNNIELENISEKVLDIIADDVFFDDIYSYRVFAEPDGDIELFDKNIRCKPLNFEIIII